MEKKVEKNHHYGVFVKAMSLKPVDARKAPPPRRTQAGGKANLANELLGQQNHELTKLKEDLEGAYEKIRNYE